MTFFNSMFESYDWQSSLIALLAIAVLTKLLKQGIFKHPEANAMKQRNHELDKKKLAQEKYQRVVRDTQRAGLYTNLTFFALILPFCISPTAGQPLNILLHVVLILMTYDFFYYLMHRFWFHGTGPMRQIHALHHQARTPTYIDAHYVHPLETFLGLALFFLTICGLSLFTGPFDIISIVCVYIIYVQLNILNHTSIDKSSFPFKTIHWIAAKHHRHHENMQMGNYASITLIFDKLFRTYE